MSTNAARRDDACPDAAGRLSLLDASKPSLVPDSKLLVFRIKKKGSVLGTQHHHISKVRLFMTPAVDFMTSGHALCKLIS
jgi:hypothetical protein